MPKGHIISSEKDRYELRVKDADGYVTTVFAKGRGVFRERSESPMIGDYVLFTQEGSEEGTITEILPRKNVLRRPPVANIDQVLVVVTLVEPEISPLQLDKLLVVLEKRKFPIVLCFNKMDRAPRIALVDWLLRYRKAGYTVFSVNAMTGENVDLLEKALQGKMTAIAGPSGAGKSTLIRRLSDEDSILVGSLSEKTLRGKQTTRTSRLFSLSEDTCIFDTPGFSSLDLRDFDSPEELADAFPEIRALSPDCYFRDCIHRKEPHCAVRAAVDAGQFDASRYASYLTFYEEVEQSRKREFTKRKK